MSILSAAAQASEPPPSPSEAISRLFVAKSVDSAWLAPSILQKISAAQLAGVVQGFTGQYGAFEEVSERGSGYLVELDRALIPASIGFDAEGRIATILFKAPIAKFASVQSAAAAFADLPGRVSLLVRAGNKDLAARDADEPLSVGSAFKLAVLRAVKQAVAQGRLSWSLPVALKDSWRALPTGILQGWPAGMQVTVEDLAALMISLSDNTAADALIDLAGRSSVEALSAHNRPFLTPREFFVLKAYIHRDLRERYIKADTQGRRAILSELATLPLPEVAAATGATTPGIEWRFSARELCAAMDAVKDLPAMHINPGLAERKQWAQIAFKGGGDDGVLNLTSWLAARNGATYCVAATWNDAGELPQQKMTDIYTALLVALREHG